MRQDFEGGIYWDELAEICGKISRAAGFRGVARFRGNMVVDTNSDLHEHIQASTTTTTATSFPSCTSTAHAALQ